MTPDFLQPGKIRASIAHANRIRALQQIHHINREKRSISSRGSFLKYCQETDLFHGQTPARHHKLLCSLLEAVFAGEIKRLLVIVPPGRAKSTYCTVRFPSWWLGRKPWDLGIVLTHTDELSTDFGRKIRDILKEYDYGAIFPSVKLRQDSNAAHRWNTGHGGGLFCAGIGATITGRRANFALLDDLISGWEEADSPTLLKKRWETYRADLRTRLLPGAPIVMVGTRWTAADIMGRILPEDWKGGSGWITSRTGEEWYVLHLPERAIEGIEDPLGRKPGEVLWPEFYTPEAVRIEEHEQGIFNWQSLFQGMPSSEQSSIIKNSWWRVWSAAEAPVCDYVVMSVDTAFTESEVEDEHSYSASAVFGVFDIFDEANAAVLKPILDESRAKRTELQRWHMILLYGWRDKCGFGELRDRIRDDAEFWSPDKILIEKKASGPSVVQELKRLRLPVKAVNPEGKGPNGISFSKTRRAYVASILWQHGLVWIMEQGTCNDQGKVKPLRHVKNDISEFPRGSSSDWVDTATQAALWMRRTWHMNLPEDDVEEEAA